MINEIKFCGYGLFKFEHIFKWMLPNSDNINNNLCIYNTYNIKLLNIF